MEGLMVLFGLALAGIAFLLPIVSFLLALGNQRRLRALEETVVRLQEQLSARVARSPGPIPREAQPAPPQPTPAPIPPLPAAAATPPRPPASPAPASPAPPEAATPSPVALPPAAAKPPAAAAAFRSRQLRLGEPGRRPAVLGGRGDRARLRRDLLPALLDRARLAAAPGPRRDRRDPRRRPARRLRAPRGAPLPDHGQRARRGRGRGPLRHVLRRPRAVAADPRLAHVPAARARGGRGGAAVDPARVDLHRRARPARRLLD